MYDYSLGTSYTYNTLESTGGLFAAIAGFGIVMLILSLGLSIFMIICMWKVFTKAGKPGWAAIVPIYNIIVMIEIANLPLWYLALLIVPIANIYAIIKIMIGIAHNFGKSTGFGVLLLFLPFVGFPMLAFGKSKDGQAPAMEQNNVVNNNFAPAPQIVNPTPQPIISSSSDNGGLSFNPTSNTELNNQPVAPAPVIETPVVNVPTPEPVTPVVETPIVQPTVTPEVSAPAPEPVVTPIQAVPTPESVAPAAPVAPNVIEPMAASPVNPVPAAPVAPAPVQIGQLPQQPVAPAAPTQVIPTPTIIGAPNQNENK